MSSTFIEITAKLKTRASAEQGYKGSPPSMSAIENLYGQLMKELENQKAQLDEYAKDLERDREKLEAEKQMMVSYHADNSDIVELNVGGDYMAVKRSTLTQVEGSMLSAMFSGRWDDKLERDRQGRVFLDFNPYCFRKILDHLRCCRLLPPGALPPVPVVPEDMQQEYNVLAEYLGIKPRNPPYQWGPRSNDGIQFLHDGYTAVRYGSNRYRYVIALPAVAADNRVWKLSILSLAPSAFLSLGVLGTASPAFKTVNCSTHDGPTSYCWCTAGQVWAGGVKHSGLDGWDGFQQRDEVVFRLIPDKGVLLMWVKRFGRSFTLSLPCGIGMMDHGNWYIHTSLLEAGTAVMLSRCSSEDLTAVGL